MTNEANARVCGRFLLLEKIGAGGFGEVWRVRDRDNDAELALKILYPQLARSDAAWQVLVREYTLASRLDHPGILRVFEPVRDERDAVLPMQYAPGGDLRKVRGTSYTRIVPLLIEVARALEHAHSRGVVHRDLKPGNVLLDARGLTLLADFGAAAPTGETAGTTPGSPFTSSPQQLAGEPPTPSDDIYGLGALAYELLSGYPPFYPNFDAERVRAEPPAPLDPVQPIPPRLEQIIWRMLAKRPVLRPASMHDVANEFQSILHDTLIYEARGASDSTAFDDDVENVTPAEPLARHESPTYTPVASVAEAKPGLPPIDIRDLDELGGDDRLPRIEDIDIIRAGKPPPRRTGVWWGVAGLAAAAVAVFAYLPKLAVVPPAPVADAPTPTDVPATPNDRERVAELLAESDALAKRVAALDQRGAALWGGEPFARAKATSAEIAGAIEQPDLPAAAIALDSLRKLVAKIESEAPAALEAQLAAASRALAAGDVAVARQAFDTARGISPSDARIAAGITQLEQLIAVAPLLADAETAAASGDTAKARQLFERVLARAPGNGAAKAGLDKLRGAASEDAFARAMGEGLAALEAGRIDTARAAFESAQRLRPDDPKVAAALARAAAASRGGADSELEQRANRLVTEERWTEALALYDQALARDPTLEFARRGRALVLPRAELSRRLQFLIERPERLAAAEVRAEADRLLARARAQAAQGPVMRSQIARLELLLPEFDRPVRLALESDNATEVAIQRVGFFGAFDRREVQLKPGQYTIIGRRSGFRDVRREFTVAPGSDMQTIVVRCIDRI